jgi:hypothetical protein
MDTMAKVIIGIEALLFIASIVIIIFLIIKRIKDKKSENFEDRSN